ncbi:MAG: hypothetical protein AAF998_24550 [Bacteroidota bacterium]
MGNPVSVIDPDGRWPWTPKWKKNARRLAERTGGELIERQNGSLDVDFYRRSHRTMYSVNFRKGNSHDNLFDNFGDPGYHFSDHLSWPDKMGYWLESLSGTPSNEFGPSKGGVAETVGQEIGAVTYQLYPGTIIAEMLTGRAGPTPQTMAGKGVMYAAMFVTPGGGARLPMGYLNSLRRAVSVQKQARHLLGSAPAGKGYLNNIGEAQAVLDAVHNGNATFLGTSRAGHQVFRFSGVTGTNVNLRHGISAQSTNVFMVKGTRSPSIVPTNPNWTP